MNLYVELFYYILYICITFFVKNIYDKFVGYVFFPATDSKGVVGGSDCYLAVANNGKIEATWLIDALATNNIW